MINISTVGLNGKTATNIFGIGKNNIVLESYVKSYEDSFSDGVLGIR